MSRRRIELGAAGETAAARWYQDNGYEVIDRNWRCRAGEIDLIVGRGRVVVFVEVKTRTSTVYGTPAEAVTPVKQRRIRRIAVAWLGASSRSAAQLRFDVASVMGDRVEVIEDAF